VDKQGRLLTTEAEQAARWAEHCSEVLNRPSPTTEEEVQHPDNDLDVSTTPPEKEKIMAAIRSLKNEKSPRLDNLSAELFKAEPEFAAQVLQSLFTVIWEEKQLPDDWTEGVIAKIPKKGALRDCNNRRGITLLSVPNKILAKLIIRWISETVDLQLRCSECCRMTESDLDQLSTFHTKSLRRILRIFWPKTISNQHLLAHCNQDSMGTIIMRRRWRWIGHVTRRAPGNISCTALHWTPEGKRKRGRAKQPGVEL